MVTCLNRVPRSGRRFALCVALFAAVSWEGRGRAALSQVASPGQVSPPTGAQPAPTPARPAAPLDVNTVVPLTFPVVGKVEWEDSFNPTDASKGRIHHGEDLMAAKLTPLVAAFDGIIFVNRTPGHNMLPIEGDNGFHCLYCHINDDTPGTHDHNGSDDYAYAPGLKSGDHVSAGQLVAWVGDSGNARGGPSHCHFELTNGGLYCNPAFSLRAARRLKTPLVILPHPELRPEPGEVRLDGVVRSFDGGKTLVMRALAVTLHNGKPSVCATPTRRWALLQPDTVLRGDTPDTLLKPEELKTEMPVTVVGKDRGNDKALLARLIEAHLPPSEPAPAPTAENDLAFGNGTRSRTGTGGTRAQNGSDASARNATQGRTGARTRPVAAARVLTASETRLIQLLNDFRREHNLSPLILDAGLSEAAWKHSLDMAAVGFYGHNGSDGSTLDVRLNLAGLVYRVAVENLAVNIAGEDGVVEAWLAQDSKSRRNLLDPALTVAGLAHVHIAAGDGLPRRVEHA